MNFYNDIDPKACAWTEELIKAGLIPPGHVACKSIADVTADELKQYDQCHFFNGISGWARALDIAGWEPTRSIWCASLPCQPFSCAGKQKAQSDERHLWPIFFPLVQQLRPELIVGEQVPAAIGLGWLDGIFADLEKEGYTCGAVVLGAHSVGAPHIRQRLYWMANAKSIRYDLPKENKREAKPLRGSVDGRLADSKRRLRGKLSNAGESEGSCSGDELSGELCGVCGGRSRNPMCSGLETITQEQARVNTGLRETFWSDSIWHQCRDGKSRRIPAEPEIFPLAPRLPGRVGLLRGAGNAICPQTAEVFIRAIMEILQK